ncbi:MAG: 5-(carboxyamino)imidazole ribonucleotide mutase [Christensenellales bacterium]|jgi:5-(carboxyamino)imidazole ribonucleotide mutase
MKKVLIVMGSKNDYAAVKPACETLREFGVEFSLRVASAHRTPVEASQIAANADKEGYGVIIGCAGKAAHLAGGLAAHTILPVIGLPILSSTLDGMDSLLSTVQMPAGIPVACVAINGAVNAALLAVQILSAGADGLKEKLIAYKEKMRLKILEDDRLIQEEIKSV